jgi:hypothetical protein
MSSKVVEPEIEDVQYAEPKKVSRFTRWYRSPLFNVIIVGFISFTQPGIWNALNSMTHALHSALYLMSPQILAQVANKSPTS